MSGTTGLGAAATPGGLTGWPQASGAGLFGLTTGNAARTRDEIAALSAELSTGYRAQDYAGLGPGARQALDLSATLDGNAALGQSLAGAASLQTVAQTALGQIQSIASQFAASATTLLTTPSAAGTVAAQARDALAQVARLLDTQYGDTYVFGGQDSRTPPVPNPDQIGGSTFFAAIQAAVAGLSTNGAAATSAQTLAIAAPGGTSPFAAGIEAAGAQSVADLGGGGTVRLAPLANANADAVSAGTGTTSTGSYTRDLLRGLASLASLTPAQGPDPNFVPFVQNIVTGLRGAGTALTTDIGALGSRQAVISARQDELSATGTALQTQLGGLQDADLAQVAAQLSTAQTRLQASYQVLASLKGLSLVNFL